MIKTFFALLFFASLANASNCDVIVAYNTASKKIHVAAKESRATDFNISDGYHDPITSNYQFPFAFRPVDYPKSSLLIGNISINRETCAIENFSFNLSENTLVR